MDNLPPYSSNHVDANSKTFGRYKVLEKIGQGGMGKVYKAYDPHLQRHVALKILTCAELASNSEKGRFIQEARITSQLSHPNIIRVYDFGIHNDIPFFTMDLIRGKPLKAILKSKRLPTAKIIKLMCKVAMAIDYAHSQGIIHRDLKPANIMINSKKEPIVMDFGLAKISQVDSGLTKSGVVLGTLQYMSPEQAQGKVTEVDKRTDVYALGAIFYELLTRKTVFESGNPAQMIYNIIFSSPTSPRKINKNISKKLEQICIKALAKKKENRYIDAKSFANDLTMFFKGKIHAKRRRWPAITICFLIFIIFVLITFQGEDSKRHEKTTNPKTLRKNSGRFTKKNEYTEKHLKHILEQDPQNFKANIALARLYQKIGKNVLARIYFDKTLSVNRNSYWAYKGKAQTFYEDKQYKEAISCYEQAKRIKEIVKLQRDDTLSLHLEMASVYLALKKEKQALQLLHSTLLEKGNDSHVLFQCAIIYHKRGLYKTARVSFYESLHFLTKEQKNSDLEKQITSKLKDAEKKLEAADNFLDKGKAYYINALIASGKYGKAITQLNKHPKIKKSLRDTITTLHCIFTYRGDKFAKENNLAKAKKQYENALKLEVFAIETYYSLIDVLQKSNDIQQALQYAKQAQSRWPQNQKIKDTIEKLKETSGH